MNCVNESRRKQRGLGVQQGKVKNQKKPLGHTNDPPKPTTTIPKSEKLTSLHTAQKSSLQPKAISPYTPQKSEPTTRNQETLEANKNDPLCLASSNAWKYKSLSNS